MENLYKFKFYVNARHSVAFDNGQSNIHPHTWEIVIYVKGITETFINFTEFEKMIENHIERYEGQYLNEMEIFGGENPTMEHIGASLNTHLSLLMKKENLQLERLEISENPTRTYIMKN